MDVCSMDGSKERLPYLAEPIEPVAPNVGLSLLFVFLHNLSHLQGPDTLFPLPGKAFCFYSIYLKASTVFSYTELSCPSLSSHPLDSISVAESFVYGENFSFSSTRPFPRWGWGLAPFIL